MIRKISLSLFPSVFRGMLLLVAASISGFLYSDDESSIKISGESYQSVDLFTTPKQRHALDGLRKQYWREGSKVVLYDVKKDNGKSNLNDGQISFKGFIKRGSSEPNIFVQADKERWLSRAEWEALVESEGTELRVTKQGKVLVLKPGQAVQ